MGGWAAVALYVDQVRTSKSRNSCPSLKHTGPQITENSHTAHSNEKRTIAMFCLVQRGCELEEWAQRDNPRAQKGNRRKQARAESWGRACSWGLENKKKMKNRSRSTVTQCRYTDWKTKVNGWAALRLLNRPAECPRYQGEHTWIAFLMWSLKPESNRLQMLPAGT